MPDETSLCPVFFLHLVCLISMNTIIVCINTCMFHKA